MLFMFKKWYLFKKYISKIILKSISTTKKEYTITKDKIKQNSFYKKFCYLT